MEQLADNWEGSYAYVDELDDAHKISCSCESFRYLIY